MTADILAVSETLSQLYPDITYVNTRRPLHFP